MPFPKKLESTIMKFLWNNDFNVNKQGRVEVRCLECNKSLGSEPRPHCSAHVLSKGSYSALRIHRQNIIPLCVAHHQQLDFGKSREMKIYDFLDERKLFLKNVYNQMKNQFYDYNESEHMYELIKVGCYTDQEIEEIMNSL